VFVTPLAHRDDHRFERYAESVGGYSTRDGFSLPISRST